MAEPRRSSLAESASAQGARFLVVEARFYEEIGALLRTGAEAALELAGASYEVASVPGALEIPIAMAIALDRPACRDAAMTALDIVRAQPI